LVNYIGQTTHPLKATHDNKTLASNSGCSGRPVILLQSCRVSFDRPYENTGSRLFINLEHELIMFLEEYGYDLGYVTDIDTHETPAYLNGIEGFISAGHDKYWTGEMFTAIEQARDNGIDLAFFGANAAFWQIRLRPDAAGRENRVMEVYKKASINPESDPVRKTVTFRSIGRAEQQLVVVFYVYRIFQAMGYVYRICLLKHEPTGQLNSACDQC